MHRIICTYLYWTKKQPFPNPEHNSHLSTGAMFHLSFWFILFPCLHPTPPKVRLLYIPIWIHTTMICKNVCISFNISCLSIPYFLGSPPFTPKKTLGSRFFFTQPTSPPFLLNNGTGVAGVATCRSRLGIESHSPRLGWRLGGECHFRKPRGPVGGRGLSNLCGVDEELATRALGFFKFMMRLIFEYIYI